MIETIFALYWTIESYVLKRWVQIKTHIFSNQRDRHFELLRHSEHLTFICQRKTSLINLFVVESGHMQVQYCSVTTQKSGRISIKRNTWFIELSFCLNFRYTQLCTSGPILDRFRGNHPIEESQEERMLGNGPSRHHKQISYVSFNCGFRHCNNKTIKNTIIELASEWNRTGPPTAKQSNLRSMPREKNGVLQLLWLASKKFNYRPGNWQFKTVVRKKFRRKSERLVWIIEPTWRFLLENRPEI